MDMVLIGVYTRDFSHSEHPRVFLSMMSVDYKAKRVGAHPSRKNGFFLNEIDRRQPSLKKSRTSNFQPTPVRAGIFFADCTRNVSHGQVPTSSQASVKIVDSNTSIGDNPSRTG